MNLVDRELQALVAYCHMAQWLKQKLEPRDWGGVLDTPDHDFTTPPNNYIFYSAHLTNGKKIENMEARLQCTSRKRDQVNSLFTDQSHVTE